MKSRDGKVFRILEDIATLVAGGSLIPPNFLPAELNRTNHPYFYSLGPAIYRCVKLPNQHIDLRS